MLRQEKLGAGPADQKNLDMQFARAIATDGGFVVGLFLQAPEILVDTALGRS